MFYTKIFPKLLPIQVEPDVPLPRIAMVIIHPDGVARPAPSIIEQVAEDDDQ